MFVVVAKMIRCGAKMIYGGQRRWANGVGEEGLRTSGSVERINQQALKGLSPFHLGLPEDWRNKLCREEGRAREKKKGEGPFFVRKRDVWT